MHIGGAIRAARYDQKFCNVTWQNKPVCTTRSCAMILFSFVAVIQAMDESFKRLYDALVNKGVLNNTIIVFLSDNGAPVPPAASFLRGSNHGSNWPLRHGKGTLFEGSVRTPSFIWTPLIPKRGRITSQLFHISDWLPTLYEAAGGPPGDLANTDGASQWQSLFRGLDDGPRTEVLLNIDTVRNHAGIIYKDFDGGLYKLISGNVFDNSFTGWYVLKTLILV